MQYVFFLGTHSALSAAECFRVLKSQGYAPHVVVAHQRYVLVTLSRQLPDDFLKQLGGSDRIALVVGQQDRPWTSDELVGVLSPAPRKFRLGLSRIGAQELDIKNVAMAIKKTLRARGSRVQFIVPSGDTSQLSSVQVLFNRLYQHPHRELTVIEHAGRFFVAQTVQVQNIQAYEHRDTARPRRDARVGMLPPKLAQIMLNFMSVKPGQSPTILDPFCGMGAVLQEGWLLGYTMIGSDMQERMIRGTEENLRWLEAAVLKERSGTTTSPSPRVFQHDARTPFGDDLRGTVDGIVTEPYLGEPVRAPLSPDERRQRFAELQPLYLAFFRHAAAVLKDDAQVVLILPTLRGRPGGDFVLFPDPLLDDIKKLGYSLKKLIPKELTHFYQATERGTLVYARPDAQVGREVTLWHIRKQADQPN